MKGFSMVWVVLLAGLCAISPASAEERQPKQWMVGTELDMAPYLFDGYYVSAVAGRGNWRVRFVRTRITTPDVATQSGFRDNELDVNAYIVDYYFQEGFQGWWVGPGFETWAGEVTEKASGVRKGYRTDILTLGGGYTYRFNDHLYINPWAAVHIPVGGDTDIAFVNSTFSLRAMPEASIKVGVNF